MRALRIVAAFIVVLIVGGVAWCEVAYPTYTYRYRMTVEVEVDGKLHAGSSVIEVRLITQPTDLVPVPAVRPEASGEAVFVDLGAGRNVVALLTSGPDLLNVDYPKYVVSTHFGLSTVKADWGKYPKLHQRWDLPANRMPALVTFLDVNDPKSARLLSQSDFGAVLGPGIRLKRVWIEMTSDPVTRDIFRRLPWLKSFKGYSGGQSGRDRSRPDRNLTFEMFTVGAIR
jgi:hypothetical protein